MAAEQIHRDLIRQVLTDPLFEDVQERPGAIHNLIIDVNLEYFAGREEAFKRVAELAGQAVAGAVKPETGDVDPEPDEIPWSIGSLANPYMTARMHGFVIERMIALDLQSARRDAAGGSPVEVRRRRAIYRVWKNFEVQALIDRSVSTVKADAARRAFLADGKNVVWAVLDSGIDERHEHFQDLENLKVTEPVRHCDFTVPGGTGQPDCKTALVDRFGHGTHVAGIIAGALVNPRTQKAVAMRTRLVGNQEEKEEQCLDSITGMAPSCKLVSMKVLDDRGRGDVGRIIAAIDTIQQINDHGRRLLIHGVNLSVGYEFDPKWFACGQSPICVEVDRLVRSGVVVVIAAGNTGYGTLSAKVRATGAGFMLTINDPGNAELAITVGSTHRDMPHTYGVSYFSSKGPTGDGRLKPDLVAPGERILSCLSTKGDPAAPANRYTEDSGTSMAAPHVSGVIAAFLSIRREYIGQPEAVKKIFMSTATDLGRNHSFQGRGLVDLMRAIQSV
ncbi:MAG: S8 family peptidase [Bryobacterales bacterium]|nr:S8 family peptidase [Bryobacterales bacterium]